MRDADDLFRNYPTLVADWVERIGGYPLQSAKGHYFNIAAPNGAGNYDYSLLEWRESRILRLLR
jgi:hypothetical protein